MLEVKETAREGEEKQYNFNFNVVFYWVGAALSLSLFNGSYWLELSIDCERY